MLCLEVILNEHRMARAGGKGVRALHVTLGGGREGPIGLTVQGLRQEKDQHLVWVKELIKTDAEVKFNVLDESLSDKEPQVLKHWVPIPAKRKELTIDVEINHQHRCKAQIGSLGFVGAEIEWCENAQCFVVEVKSIAREDSGHAEPMEWFKENLRLGDSLRLCVQSDE